MSTFNQMINKTRTRKITLVHMRSSKRLRFFNSTGLNTYSKLMDFFVDSFKVDGIEYTSTTGSLTTNTFNYDPSTKLITFKTNGANPNTVYSVVTFKHFFSNIPLILPHDLATGVEVEYEARVKDLASTKLELDIENKGIAVESDSSIVLESNDGYFAEIFDTHIFENKNIEFYLWFENLLMSDVKLTYRGVVQDKSYTSQQVKFSIKDSFVSLRDKLELNLFDTGDGNYDDSLYLKPKRRIYGEVSRLQVVGVDKLKSMRLGIGTISSSGLTIIGSGTNFLDTLTSGDTVEIEVSQGRNTVVRKIGVQDVIDNTHFTASEEIAESFSGKTYKINTEVYSKHTNRRFNIAGHKLVELAQPITALTESSRAFQVANIDGFEVGSLVTLNGSNYTIIRSHDNLLVFNQNVSPTPNVGNVIYRVPCFKAYLGIKELTYKSEYEIENLASGATLVLSPQAEANVTTPVITTFNLNFSNGSSTVTGTVDLTKIFNSRDLIKPNTVNYATYYEVLTVFETYLTLRSTFSETSINTTGLHKKVDYVKDDSIVAVDCLGIATDSGYWIRYPSEVVEHILTKDAEQVIDSSSFLDARGDAEFKISCFYPDSIGGESPTIRDAITTINNSVFGSLYYNGDFQFKYSILNSNKPEFIPSLMDDDIISYEILTKNIIVNSAKINYKPHTDLLTGEITPDALIADSEFVDQLIGFSKYEVLDTVLFNESDAQTILNRFLFFRSLTNSLVKLKTKLNIVNYNLNDPVKLTLDRLYTRYAGSDKTKIGIVNYIEKDETSCTLQINDLGGIFNRVPAIAPDSLVDISSSDLESIARFGFIVDNINEVPDNLETYSGANLIG